MAAGTTIKIKRKAGAFSGGDLAAGELGIDTTTDQLYASTNGTTVFIIASTVFDQDDMSSNSAAALATQQSIKAYVDANVISSGSVHWFAADTPPTGFLECDGSSLSTTTYADLYAVIGYTFGGSGGSFNIPDLRGEFIRGWDNSRGVDSGRSFGSAQDDEFESHTHAQAPDTILYSGGGVVNVSGSSTRAAGGTTSATGGAETRPRNIALLPCIKY